MRRAALPPVAALLLLAGCARDPSPTTTAAASGSSEPASAAAALDTRRPVPLLPAMAEHQKQNMRDHLAAVEEIVTALANDDLTAVERAAGRIGFSESMGQMCDHMGAGAPGFTEQALHFHHRADRIGDAARGGDRTGVVTELGATLQICVSCHAMWKQQVVDDATWQRLTSMSPPPGAPAR